jgi:K(+)-stimulated pyrophosphate-energized sodium pump
MNILIKLTCLIGLVIAPILGGHDVVAVVEEVEAIEVVEGVQSENKEISIDKSKSADGVVTANVTINTTVGGETKTLTQTFIGTEEEVTTQIEAFKNQ